MPDLASAGSRCCTNTQFGEKCSFRCSKPTEPSSTAPAATTGGRHAWARVELDADEGAWLLAALDLARFDVSAKTPHTFDVSAETPHTFDVSAETPRTRADALMVLVESFLAEGARSRTGGTPTEVRLHVTEDELENGGAFIENAGCVGVSAETSTTARVRRGGGRGRRGPIVAAQDTIRDGGRRAVSGCSTA